ncbi:hypothetical protein GX50_07776 [[Emmonsia] crescens]|uniref:Uncharacterized protein n=1 Tax=[Emmonsia] crescens TaxID=73230 RepID=A0A2B7Z7C9_9EURO|nr:hypothetical protein GX50_07776 [Emmonsia crescens]
MTLANAMLCTSSSGGKGTLSQYESINLKQKLQTQKLSFIGIVALLATAATSTPIEASVDNFGITDWRCVEKTGGDGHNRLKELHTEFNKLFGERRLKVASGQCYVAVCKGYSLALCNYADSTKREISGHRNVARNANPGTGKQCLIYPGNLDLMDELILIADIVDD